jgi:PKD repeat protein
MQKGKSPYEQGYVFSRYDKIIPEYTLGKDNSVPDKELAQERFERRRLKVEYYYKKLGIIENRFKGMFVNPPVFMLKTFIGIFRMPSIAINDYKYNRDPKYKEMVDKKDEEEYRAEKERIKTLKTELKNYIDEDLKNEPAAEVKPVVIETPVVTEKAPESITAEPVREDTSLTVKEEKPESPAAPSAAAVAEEQPQAQPIVAQEARGDKQEAAMAKVKEAKEKPVKVKTRKSHPAPVAVISAKPTKGPGPLNVQFSAAKSSVSGGRIVSYLWDFGDGDTSTKKNPKNTYWSATLGSRFFRATLTVTDDLGQTATAGTDIEVTTD